MKTRAQSSSTVPWVRNPLPVFIPALLLGLLTVGCASTKVTSRAQVMTGQLPRPATVWVYDFTANAAELPPDSPLAGQPDALNAAQTPEQLEAGRQLGAQIASELVQQISRLGLPAARALPETIPQTNDLVLRGYLLSMETGSAAKRVAIGFGSGESELRTLVEGFQVTPQGHRRLGSGTLESGSGKSPGGAVGLATFLATSNPAGLIVSSGVKLYGEASGKSKLEGRAQATAKEIAAVLQQRFRQQGWIP